MSMPCRTGALGVYHEESFPDYARRCHHGTDSPNLWLERMSLLDQHRAELARARGAAHRDRQALLIVAKKLTAKRSEAGRAKTPTRQASLAREIEALERQKLSAEQKVAAREKTIGDLSTKVFRDEVRERENAARKQRRMEVERTQRTLAMEEALSHAAGQVQDLSERVVDLEDSLIERVRGDVQADVLPRQHDVFLSHASADRDFASLLYQELAGRDLDVWFDQAELRLGESVMRQIDRGIADSRCGVLLITDAFLGGRFWTEREMAALVSGRRRVNPSVEWSQFR